MCGAGGGGVTGKVLCVVGRTWVDEEMLNCNVVYVYVLYIVCIYLCVYLYMCICICI